MVRDSKLTAFLFNLIFGAMIYECFNMASMRLMWIFLVIFVIGNGVMIYVWMNTRNN